LAEINGVNVGRDLISRVTDAVVEDVRVKIRSTYAKSWSRT